jgi:hypothetical protein
VDRFGINAPSILRGTKSPVEAAAMPVDGGLSEVSAVEVEYRFLVGGDPQW